ncbi:helix-turn-helix domain-containing protein [Paenibacillus lemnae]|uniref:Helix-turn-helix domain-containing protein n=1 Tax=Paenibacillus lemnae TaxID=1330551 RepID=A0A848M5R3_PAELE|nr:helix-turn-helix domain-containing protein [Paenibacillus lemnae]NMO94944.1 helix-turn-helix domain-containing protein [Paenibacillus lemnae]
MVMRPTVIERTILTGPSAEVFVKKMVETDQLLMAALVKNLLFTVKGAERYIHLWDETCFLDRERLSEYASTLLQHISRESSSEHPSHVSFSTTEVAKYIGVTVQTVNTWIREGKISGVEKERNRWTKIPEDAVITFAHGKAVPVSVLKANWEAENQEPQVDEAVYLNKSIQEFEQKYGGPFEEIFGDKTIRELTEEDTDASVWWSYKARLSSATAISRNKENNVF